MKDFNVPYNKERKKTQFFIDRNGKKVTFQGNIKEEIISMHYEIAKKCFPNLEYPDDYITKELGWIMVGSSVFNCPVTYKKPSEKQISTIKKLKLFDRLIFEYKGDNPDLKRFMPNYVKYGILCSD